MDTCSHEGFGIAKHIILYLSRHPGAEDTLDGIAEKWLPGGGPVISRTMLREVISDLIAQGLVETSIKEQGHVLYRQHRRHG